MAEPVIPSSEEERAAMLMPIRMYLEREFGADADRVLGYLLFVGCGELGHYIYRNRITRSSIIVSEAGELVQSAKDSLHTLAVYKTLFPKRKYSKKERRA